MTVFPLAKINLGLNVVAKREDGYHDLETVFWPVSGIHDELTVTEARDHDSWRLSLGTELCAPEKNLVVKAYELLRQDFQLPGVDITLNKQLPSQAGMGGGSSDGAYMVKALDALFKLGLTTEQMQQYAVRLGADCPFFINPIPSYATGIGDKLEPITVNSSLFTLHYSLIIIKPDVAVSTKEAYAGIRPKQTVRNCRDIVVNEPVERWRDVLHNDFEDSIFPKLPILKEIKESLYRDGALYAAMSGSGSTIYGIFNNKIDLNKYAKYYNKILSF